MEEEKEEEIKKKRQGGGGRRLLSLRQPHRTGRWSDGAQLKTAVYPTGQECVVEEGQAVVVVFSVR